MIGTLGTEVGGSVKAADGRNWGTSSGGAASQDGCRPGLAKTRGGKADCGMCWIHN